MSTDCKADALTTTPSRRLVLFDKHMYSGESKVNAELDKINN